MVSHEKIARVSLDCYESLPKTGKPGEAEWTVLSTVVGHRNGFYRVVALGTGSKCIGRSKMTANGDVLNDSHAEVVCRRAFLAYLYGEMLKTESTLLTLVDGKFVVDADVDFHFFTTHAPCGDASIFPRGTRDDVGSVVPENEDRALREDCLNIQGDVLNCNVENRKDNLTMLSEDARSKSGDANTKNAKDAQSEVSSRNDEVEVISSSLRARTKQGVPLFDTADEQITLKQKKQGVSLLDTKDGGSVSTNERIILKRHLGVADVASERDRRAVPGATSARNGLIGERIFPLDSEDAENPLRTAEGNEVTSRRSESDFVGRQVLRDDGETALSDNEKSEAGGDPDRIDGKRLCREGDIFRTGAKCLPDDVNDDPRRGGVNYHVIGAVRTKPGRGDRTLSVSCSDKLAKWCHLGIQGCLLSALLKEPIYLKSFTITGNAAFSADALNRALFNRFPTVNLREPYGRRTLRVGQVRAAFPFGKRDGKRPSPASIIYTKSNEKKTEVAVEGRKQGVAKKNAGKKSSRLSVCKLSLLAKFSQVVRKYGLMKDVGTKHTYRDLKAMCGVYNDNWSLIKASLFKVWTVKDAKLLEFYES